MTLCVASRTSLCMKKFILAGVLGLALQSSALAANCEKEAEDIAWGAIGLFSIGDFGMHCKAMGDMTELNALPVPAVMPVRYAYEAKFFFPCGPTPREPVVTMTLNQDCKISKLEVSGFSL